MNISQEGLEFIEQQEGCVLHVYQDPAGNPTIGVGHLIKAGEDYSNGLTQAQAMDLLAQDVKRFEDAVNSYGLNLTQNQFDVLVDFAFNAGEGALQQLLSHGLDAVPDQLPNWVHAHKDGQLIVVEALVNRRAAEVTRWNA
ncbi:MAG: lysozyme [Desulfobaccales bacterium]